MFREQCNKLKKQQIKVRSCEAGHRNIISGAYYAGDEAGRISAEVISQSESIVKLVRQEASRKNIQDHTNSKDNIVGCREVIIRNVELEKRK